MTRAADTRKREVDRAAGGMETFATTPEEFTALIRRDYDKYGKIVKTTGIRVD